MDSLNVRHGYVLVGGSFYSLDITGATATQLRAINNSNQVGGVYTDSNGTQHAFVAQLQGVVPEPGAFALAGLGLTLLAAARVFAKRTPASKAILGRPSGE